MNRREFVASVVTSLAVGSGRESLSLAGNSEHPKAEQLEQVRGIEGPFRIIDVHAHTLNTGVIASDPKLAEAARQYSHIRVEGEVEKLVRQMDSAGVEHAFLLTYSAEDLAAEIRFRGQLQVDPVLLNPVVNRAYQIRGWQAHRDRFWLFVNHSNALRESFPEDLERDFEEGAVGWKYMPIFYGFLADNGGYWPAYEICRRRRCPVILDLSNWHIGEYPLYNEVAERQQAVQSFKDYAGLLDPLFSEFETVPICLAHLGTPKGEQDYEAILDFVRRHPNALIDTSPANLTAPSVERHRMLVEAVGARKIMWGTDWPFGQMDSWRVISDQCDFLTEKEKRLMTGGNALRFVQGQV